MPDLEVFEAEVKAKLKLLSSKDANARRQAAAWLGEAGDPMAITALAQTYKNDSDARVREAAGYALGMFRSLEAALGSDKADQTMKVLEDVALRGKFGRRLRWPVKRMVKLIIALLLSAALIAAAGTILPGVLRGSAVGSGGSVQVIPTVDPQAGQVLDLDRPTLVKKLQSALDSLNANTTQLQARYQGVLGGDTLDCSQTFLPMEAIALSANNSASFPDLAATAGGINAAQATFTIAKSTFDRACAGENIPAGDYGAPMGQVMALLQTLPSIQTGLSGEAAATLPALEPTAAVPTEAPLPTAAVDLRPHLVALQTIIDDMTALRGANTVLNQFWTESTSAAGTTGCSADRPTLPADYVLPGDVQAASSDLTLVAGLVNTGLVAVRQSWALFDAGCAAGSPIVNAQQGLTLTQAAATAFASASEELNKLRGGA